MPKEIVCGNIYAFLVSLAVWARRKGMVYMGTGKVLIYTGDGHGKSPAAIGKAVQAATVGRRVVVIQFLKCKGMG